MISLQSKLPSSIILIETQPLAVETKVSADITPESSPRSEQSADKSGDSGISGDHAHSDHRIDSPGHVSLDYLQSFI